MITKIEAARVPPHVALRQEIAKRRNSASVALGGLGPVLDMLDAYIAATDARVAALEDAVRAAAILVSR